MRLTTDSTQSSSESRLLGQDIERGKTGRRARLAVLGGTLCLCAFAAAGIAAQPALADPSQQTLMPDPNAACVANEPYQLQVANDDWVVNYTGVSGDPDVNDWACTYSVTSTIPLANFEYGDDADDGALPGPTWTVVQPIDWEAMCSEQYAGSTAEWVGVPGPITTAPGPYGAPWMCLGAPGAQYDQTETNNGPVGLVS